MFRPTNNSYDFEGEPQEISNEELPPFLRKVKEVQMKEQTGETPGARLPATNDGGNNKSAQTPPIQRYYRIIRPVEPFPPYKQKIVQPKAVARKKKKPKKAAKQKSYGKATEIFRRPSRKIKNGARRRAKSDAASMSKPRRSMTPKVPKRGRLSNMRSRSKTMGRNKAHRKASSEDFGTRHRKATSQFGLYTRGESNERRSSRERKGSAHRRYMSEMARAGTKYTLWTTTIDTQKPKYPWRVPYRRNARVCASNCKYCCTGPSLYFRWIVQVMQDHEWQQLISSKTDFIADFMEEYNGREADSVEYCLQTYGKNKCPRVPDGMSVWLKHEELRAMQVKSKCKDCKQVYFKDDMKQLGEGSKYWKCLNCAEMSDLVACSLCGTMHESDAIVETVGPCCALECADCGKEGGSNMTFEEQFFVACSLCESMHPEDRIVETVGPCCALHCAQCGKPGHPHDFNKLEGGLAAHRSCSGWCDSCQNPTINANMTQVREGFIVCEMCVSSWKPCEICSTKYLEPQLTNGVGPCCVCECVECYKEDNPKNLVDAFGRPGCLIHPWCAQTCPECKNNFAPEDLLPISDYLSLCKGCSLDWRPCRLCNTAGKKADQEDGVGPCCMRKCANCSQIVEKGDLCLLPGDHRIAHKLCVSPCHSCSKHTLKNDLTSVSLKGVDGFQVCPQCIHKWSECGNCGKLCVTENQIDCIGQCCLHECAECKEWAKNSEMIQTPRGQRAHENCALACRRCIKLQLKSNLTAVAEGYSVCQSCVKLWNACKKCGTLHIDNQLVNGVGICCIHKESPVKQEKTPAFTSIRCVECQLMTKRHDLVATLDNGNVVHETCANTCTDCGRMNALSMIDKKLVCKSCMIHCFICHTNIEWGDGFKIKEGHLCNGCFDRGQKCLSRHSCQFLEEMFKRKSGPRNFTICVGLKTLYNYKAEIEALALLLPHISETCQFLQAGFNLYWFDKNAFSHAGFIRDLKELVTVFESPRIKKNIKKRIQDVVLRESDLPLEQRGVLILGSGLASEVRFLNETFSDEMTVCYLQTSQDSLLQFVEGVNGIYTDDFDALGVDFLGYTRLAICTQQILSRGSTIPDKSRSQIELLMHNNFLSSSEPKSMAIFVINSIDQNHSHIKGKFNVYRTSHIAHVDSFTPLCDALFRREKSGKAHFECPCTLS